MSMIRASVSMIRASQTFVLAVNSVVDVMKEVEVKEKVVEEVKEKAVEVRVYAKLLVFMKHAGEVCAEKAILATELKELQLRLFTMSDEISLNALTKVDLFASPPAVAIAASSPAIDFFADTEQVLHPYHRIMPRFTDLNLHPRLVITMINCQNPTQEAFKMVQAILRKL
ncbi:hypothetical protein Tco_1093591 [Tanacetum coccineum]|uniref:Uncharacterized protein n=1 Tax=Tanacetum coccineum TaxID=301880 RepID=A0ABQ5ID53_9ASTR